MRRNWKTLHHYLSHNREQSMFCPAFISPHSTQTVLPMLINFGIQVPRGILYKLVYFLTHFLRWPDPAHTTLKRFMEKFIMVIQWPTWKQMKKFNTVYWKTQEQSVIELVTVSIYSIFISTYLYCYVTLIYWLTDRNPSKGFDVELVFYGIYICFQVG